VRALSNSRRLAATMLPVALVAAAVMVVAVPAAAGPPPAPRGGAPVPDGPNPATVQPDQRDKVLPRGWRTSDDVAWTTSGDGDGFHVMTASARSGYTWQTVATLSEPGFDVDQWIGNACLTGSGRRLVVVYAPRTFTNKPDLFDRGGFTAVVDLSTRAVTKLPVQGSLAYFNPGCGAGEKAVLAQYGGERVDAPAGKLRSRLLTVDAAEGTVSAPILLNTEVSSAVPVAGGIVAAGTGRLVRVHPDGKLETLASTHGVPFRLTTDTGDGLAFMEQSNGRARVKWTRTAVKAPVTTVAEGPLTAVGVVRGAGGRMFVTGKPAKVAALPAGMRTLDTPRGSEVSTTGAVTLTRVHDAGADDPRLRVDAPADPRPVKIEAKVPATGKNLSFTVAPSTTGPHAAEGRATHPSLTRGGSRPGPHADAMGSPTDPVEAERTCSVPRNDPHNQALQPKPRQAEWAVDQAITDSLHLNREANWKNLGMPAYSPQGLFPYVPLEGGGRIPAQAMLGLLAQESNMWQAARYALPGVTANPLIGNYYGRNIYNEDPSDDWDINWDNADCGYGVAQVTDGMRLAGHEKPGEHALPYQTQRAVALDFAANIAAGVSILANKWNETYRAGVKVHDGDPSALENWYFALWAYNSGFHPDTHDGLPWGVGWLNNPINPRFDQQRDPFLEYTYDDARNPQRWPYQEKVLGWAGHPINLNESPDTMVAGYRAAWWVDVQSRVDVMPPHDLFCNDSNNCDPHAEIQPTAPDVRDEPPGPCAHLNDQDQYDLRCWYHEPVHWKTDAQDKPCSNCGNEVLRFDPGYPYQDDGTSFPPKCDLGGLTAGARIIDDVPDGTVSIRPNCGRPWTNAGTFGLNFTADATGHYPSKVDFHQIGGGFGGHMWRASTVQDWFEGGKLKVTAAWTLAEPINGWTRIQVSVPDFSAWTRQADYTISLGNGQTRHRVVNQVWQQHRWIDLGVFPLAGRASVSLSNVTTDGFGTDSVIFDAVAFTPTSRPSAIYVAMGDSYASGEGVEPYDRNSDYTRDLGDENISNACHRSQGGAYPRLVTLPGHSVPIAQEAAGGTAAFSLIACSGALTTSVTDDAVDNPPTDDDRAGHTDWLMHDQHYGEVAQVDQGYLDEDTSLVSISIGGNDARFADTMHGCIASIGSCYDDDFKLTRGNGVVDPEPFKYYESKLILQWLPQHLRAVYWAIHRKAPNAKILVVGYTQLSADMPWEGCNGLSTSTQPFLNNLAGMLTLTIANAVHQVQVEGVDISFVDPTPKWRRADLQDSHWACGQQAWLNDWILSSNPGSGREVPGRGSWHPNAEGQRQLAGLVSTALQGQSSTEAVTQRITDYFASRAADGWAITADQARYAALRCLDLTRRGGLVGDPCMHEPMLLSSVQDAGGAARNDAEALDTNPAWVQLNYMSGDNKGKVLDRSWMDSVPQTSCPSPRPAGMQCDEHPLYSSEAGGSWDRFLGETSPVSTRLKLVPLAENRAEGVQAGAMYRKTECRMTSGTYDLFGTPTLATNGSPYLVIPLIDSDRVTRTRYVC
jgi:hypothetical protein